MVDIWVREVLREVKVLIKGSININSKGTMIMLIEVGLGSLLANADELFECV